MSLRGLAVLGVFILSLPVALIHPFVGVLTWNWLAYLNPHQQTWGSLAGYRLAMIVALVTIAGLLLSGRDGFRIVRGREVGLLGLFFATLIVSTAAAENPSAAFEKLTQYAKIFLMCYVMMCLVKTERRFRILTWTTALFVCAIGIKGAVLAPMRGFPMIFGPERSFMEDNNDYALAMNMMLPFFWALGATERDRRLKMLWYAGLILTVVAVLFTYSRGGYLGLGLTMLWMTIRSRRKTVGVVVLAAGVFAIAFYSPQRLRQRIGTLEVVDDVRWDEREQRASVRSSAQDRVRAWRVGWAMGTSRPLTGVGLRNFVGQYWRYSDELAPDYAKVAHSAYFHLLGEAGFPAVIVFLAVIVSALLALVGLRRRLRRARRETKAAAEWEPTGEPASEGTSLPAPLIDRLERYVVMCETSIISYAATAAFLSRADFDLYFQVVAMVVMLRQIVPAALAEGTLSGTEEAAAEEPEPALAPSAR